MFITLHSNDYPTRTSLSGARLKIAACTIKSAQMCYDFGAKKVLVDVESKMQFFLEISIALFRLTLHASPCVHLYFSRPRQRS